jgi:hypothetical protein
MPQPLDDAVGEFVYAVTGMEADPELVEAISDIIKRNLGIEEVDEVLGSGSYGTASAVGDRVLKITADPEEVQAAHNIVGERLANVVRFDGAWYLGDLEIQSQYSGLWQRVGVTLMERLDWVGTGDPDSDAVLNSIVREIKDSYEVWPNFLERVSRTTARQRLKAASLALAERLAEAGGPLADLANGLWELYDRGIYAVDVHRNNVGWSERDQTYKIFDIGASSAPARKKAPVVKNPGGVPELPGDPADRWPAVALTPARNPVPELR